METAEEKLYQSMAMTVFLRFLRHRLAVAGAVVVIILILATSFADMLTSHDPVTLKISNRFKAPFEMEGHILGTDEIGRDILSRILHGGRVSIVVGVIAMLASVVTGGLVGVIAGY